MMRKAIILIMAICMTTTAQSQRVVCGSYSIVSSVDSGKPTTTETFTWGFENSKGQNYAESYTKIDDLNKYISDSLGTDYNHTELNDNDVKELERKGIYWVNKRIGTMDLLGYYKVKRKTSEPSCKKKRQNANLTDSASTGDGDGEAVESMYNTTWFQVLKNNSQANQSTINAIRQRTARANNSTQTYLNQSIGQEDTLTKDASTGYINNYQTNKNIMGIIKAVLALLGLGGASLTLFWLLFAAFNLLWAILSAILATRRGRNAVNWFFLTCIYGIFGLLFLACSKTINQGEYRESDTLSRVLWSIFIIPTMLIAILAIVVSVEKQKDDELTRKVMEDMRQEEQMHQNSDEDNIPTFDEWN